MLEETFIFVESINEVIITGPVPNEPVPSVPATTSPIENPSNPFGTDVVIVAVYGPVGAPDTVPIVHAKLSIFDIVYVSPVPLTTVAVAFLTKDIGSTGAYLATEIWVSVV